MPGCAAIGCNNRSEKGYSMRCFPRDPLLRQMWKERVGRANWEPSKNSFLCHDHFEADQWAETETGKVKLKRDAIPSVFKETATRKSPRKQRLENGNQSSYSLDKCADKAVRVSAVKIIDDESDNENYTLEYLDECEYEVSFASAGKTPKTNDNKPFNCLPRTTSPSNVAYHIVSEKDMSGLEKENIIIVSDENNKEIGKLIHNNESIIIVADENNKEIGQIVVENDLIEQSNAEIKQQENYDEIEEKLKQICNGEDVTVTLTAQRERPGPLTQKEGNSKPENYVASSNLDKEIPGNIKFIFGNESGEESRGPDDSSPQKNPERNRSAEKNEAPKITTKGKELLDKTKATEIQSRDLNHGSSKLASKTGAASRAPNSRAPFKRQKKSREDVMRSIETAVAELSERTLHSVQNDQLTKPVLRIARARKKGSVVTCTYKRPLETMRDTIELDGCDSSPKKSKFTIKVTGVADDVSEIMEGLESSSMRRKTESNKQRDNSTRKYVLAEEINEQDLAMIDSRFTKGRKRSMRSSKSEDELSSDFDSIDFAQRCIIKKEIHPRYRKSYKSQLSNIRHEPSAIERLFTPVRELDTKMQRKKLSSGENGKIRIDGANFDEHNNRFTRLKYFSKSQDPSRELQQKINAQQEVIGKLTNQLIIYKGLEAKLTTLNFQYGIKTKEIETLKNKLEKKSQTQIEDRSECKNDADIKDKTISDLSNKLNRLKEANKKLTQQLAAECQNRKSAYQLKQKDEQIKEMKWKLEKASKFLDRAEKNANTYKRKMVSLQTAIRRQKASEAKRNHFQELLIDNAKHEFSESALLTAMDIKNTCGIKCYQKLLTYNFPLPSLRTLRRRFQKENVTEDDWGDEDQEPVENLGNSDVVTNTETSQSNELGESEVTGTVQDIFEENNDPEELNSSELGEQIFLQLNNDKKFADS